MEDKDNKEIYAADLLRYYNKGDIVVVRLKGVDENVIIKIGTGHIYTATEYFCNFPYRYEALDKPVSRRHATEVEKVHYNQCVKANKYISEEDAILQECKDRYPAGTEVESAYGDIRKTISNPQQILEQGGGLKITCGKSGALWGFYNGKFATIIKKAEVKSEFNDIKLNVWYKNIYGRYFYPTKHKNREFYMCKHLDVKNVKYINSVSCGIGTSIGLEAVTHEEMKKVLTEFARVKYGNNEVQSLVPGGVVDVLDYKKGISGGVTELWIQGSKYDLKVYDGNKWAELVTSVVKVNYVASGNRAEEVARVAIFGAIPVETRRENKITFILPQSKKPKREVVSSPIKITLPNRGDKIVLTNKNR
jgi:hypothetical protein